MGNVRKIYQIIKSRLSLQGGSKLKKSNETMTLASGAFSATKCDHDHLKSAKPPRLVFKITKIYVKTMVNNLSKCQFL